MGESDSPSQRPHQRPQHGCGDSEQERHGRSGADNVGIPVRNKEADKLTTIAESDHHPNCKRGGVGDGIEGCCPGIGIKTQFNASF